MSLCANFLPKHEGLFMKNDIAQNIIKIETTNDKQEIIICFETNKQTKYTFMTSLHPPAVCCSCLEV